MIDKDKKYILNPAYFMRNYIHRAVIGSFDFPDMPDRMYEKNYFDFNLYYFICID